MLTPRRVESDELLDAHDAPAADVERSLRDLRWINRHWGGVAIYRRLVKRFEPRSVLDVGAGSGDLLEGVAGVPLRVGLDFKIDHLLFMRARSGIRRVVGNARCLPFRDGSVDLVTSSHFLHHFSPDENAGILGEAMRVARKGIAVTDTRRHYVPLLLVRLLGAVGAFGRITRFDAPASILQGYTVGEARRIADRVPAARRDVAPLWPYRLAILMWKR